MMASSIGSVLFGVMLSVAMSCVGERTPTQKCEDLILLFCDRTIECSIGQQRDTCIQQARTDLPCGKATGVSSNYDLCMDQMAEFSCEAILSVGGGLAECEDTILLPPDALDGR